LGEVLISDSTLQELHSKVQIRGQKQVKLKGVKDRVTLHIVEGIEGQYTIKLPEEVESFTPLAQPLPMKYIFLDGKHIDDAEIAQTGVIIQSSGKSVIVQLPPDNKAELPPVLTNLQIELGERGNGADEIYAKVVGVDPAKRQFTVRLTSGAIAV